MLHKIKKILTATPVQFNDKPIALWKFLIPLLLMIIIPLTVFIIKELNPPLTPEQVAETQYKKAQQDANNLSQTVAKQTAVPTDETPNVATINDLTELQNQDFFKQAKIGDKILIYEKAKIIVLYRPDEKRVIATAPVLYNQPETAVAATSSAIPASSSAQ